MVIKGFKRMWRNHQKRRVLKAYYATERKGPKSEKILRYLLVLVGFIYLVFRRSSTFNSAVAILGIIVLVLFAAYFLTERAEKKMLEQKCRKKLASTEFRKRIERAAWEDVIEAIKERVSEKFKVQDLIIEGNRLQGLYKDRTIAIYYCAVEEDESVKTQDIISIIKKCRRDGITDIKIFTNNEFASKAHELGERFDLKLMFFEGEKLQELLRETGYTPTNTEIDSLITRESEKRRKRIALIKEEALRGEKYITYLIYGSLLLGMAWQEIGIFYLNLAFGGILYFLFIYTLYKKISHKEEELLF